MIGKMYNRNGYVMQLHISTYLDANRKYVNLVGQSTGFDCADDTTRVQSVGELLNSLTLEDALSKTILYFLDRINMENYEIRVAGFCEKGVKSKVQLGAS